MKFGRIVRKFSDNSLIFPDEKIFGKPIWVYRFEFSKIFVVDDWRTGVAVRSNIMLNVGRKVIDKSIFLQLVEKAEQQWNQNISKQIHC